MGRTFAIFQSKGNTQVVIDLLRNKERDVVVGRTADLRNKERDVVGRTADLSICIEMLSVLDDILFHKQTSTISGGDLRKALCGTITSRTWV